MKSNHVSVRFLCVTAMMTALICVMTAIPRIPIPLGYAHLGDAFILIAVLFAGKREGIWAAGIGSALADLLGGFPIWCIPTLLIKTIMALILGWIAYDKDGNCSLFTVRAAVGCVVSMLWMVFGYTIAGAILYGGILVGLTSTPGLLIKGALNLVIAYGVGSLLEKANLRRVFVQRRPITEGK
ncbi:MAG: ECF transporter S component [Butyricicoccus sp.]